MNIQVNAELLEALSEKTGQPKEVFLAQAAQMVDTHLRQLLATTPESAHFEDAAVAEAMQEIMQDYADAFHELAR